MRGASEHHLGNTRQSDQPVDLDRPAIVRAVDPDASNETWPTVQLPAWGEQAPEQA